MSFRVEFTLEGVEFRSRQSRTITGRDGKPATFRNVRVEDAKGNPVEIGVRDESLWEHCLAMRKGDFYNLPCIALATNEYNFLNLDGEPELVPDPTEV